MSEINIQITGGSAATSSTLISWLQNNGTITQYVNIYLNNTLTEVAIASENKWANASISGKTLTFPTSDTTYIDGRELFSTSGETQRSVSGQDGIVENGYYVYDDSTWLDLTTLGLAAGTHTITAKATAVDFRDSNFSNEVSYTVEPLQLSTPQNVTASGTAVSWDEVENAASYDILADGVSIGEYTQQPEPTTISIKIAYQNTFGPSYHTYKVNDGAPTEIKYRIGSGSSTSLTLEQLQAIPTEVTDIEKLEVRGSGSLDNQVRIYNSNGVLTHNFNNGEAHEKYFDITQYIENGGYVVIYGDD